MNSLDALCVDCVLAVSYSDQMTQAPSIDVAFSSHLLNLKLISLWRRFPQIIPCSQSVV